MNSKTWRQTFTGRAFDLLEPDPASVNIMDIAHSLSQQCRYTGHTTRHYSVAEHSILVAMYAEHAQKRTTREIFHALMHDAGETYTGDISTPVKVAVPEIRTFCAKIDGVVLGAFGLPADKPEWLDEIDCRIRHDEKRALMVQEPADWGLDPRGPLNITLQLWSAPEAERNFLIVAQNLKQLRDKEVPLNYDPRCGLCGPAKNKVHIGKCKVAA